MQRAFASFLAADVERVVASLPASQRSLSGRTIGDIRLRGERLFIPARVYSPPLTDSMLRSEREHLIAACIDTRHHDGHVRERNVHALLASREAWVVPFVVQLLGESVVEIVEIIARCEGLADRPEYRSFLEENPQFAELTRQRAISYWHCYHRSRYAVKNDYPALRVLGRMQRVA